MSRAAPGAVVRAEAARTLDAVLHQGRSLKAGLAAVLPAIADPRDRALLEAICFAAIRQHSRYNAALDQWLKTKLGRRDGVLRALLLAGFAQIDALELQAHAALSATVEAARVLGFSRQAGMVNALLRRAQREGLPVADPARAWPEWLRSRVCGDWPGQADAVFQASARPAPLWLRVNCRRGSREDYAALLRSEGHAVELVEQVVDGLYLSRPVAVATLPGFAEGRVSVQDGSAQLVADALSPPAGARVLDACAAPGGKTAHLLERDPSLRLLALDVDPVRLRRIDENLSRLGLPAVLLAADAGRPADWWDGEPFDAILLDAPCSATGVVRRQPDVLLHRKPADIDALRALQGQLLDALWPLLAPGGVLVYATCSILREENALQVGAFLQRTPDAVAEPLDDRFGQADGAGRQRLPGDAQMDGFFTARLRKSA